MLSSTRRPTLRLRLATAMILGVVSATLATAGPSFAVPPSTPTGPAVEWPDPATAILSWSPSQGAVKYNVEIADTLSFTNPIRDTTANTRYVPTAKLKPGTWYWRVQALNATSEPSGWVFSELSVATVAAPTLGTPGPDVTLAQPDNVPLLTWSMPAGTGAAGAAGVESYKVEVSNNNFTTAKTYTTKSTALAVPEPLSLGTWRWRVTAVKSTNPLITSAPSPSRAFTIVPLAQPGIVGPRNNVAVTDVVLDWNPVPGAKGYELQVSRTTDFSGALVENLTLENNKPLVLGTKYSPPKTYDNNNTYYWQVRAVDAAGNSSEWAKSGTPFQRNYPYAPSLTFPANGALDVPAPYYFDWTSVKHASRYQFQIADNENMSGARTCMVAGTSYTPGVFRYKDTEPFQAVGFVNENCDPWEGRTNYWRVRALDRPFTDPNDPGGVIEGLEGDSWSDKFSFKAGGMSVTGITQTQGGLPTISWDPAVGAHSYRLEITGPNYTKTATTHTTSYTPDGKTALLAGTYEITIWARTFKGVSSLGVSRAFTVSGTVPAPVGPELALLSPAAGATVPDVPQLRWEPMTGAGYYEVVIADSDNVEQSSTTGLVGKPVHYPSLTDTSDLLEKGGLYTWYVKAYTANGGYLGRSAISSFRIPTIPSVTGNELALTGRELDRNAPAGTRSPCTTAPTSGQCVVPATPVFRWDPIPDTAFYVVYLAEDASFTQLLEPTYVAATTNTMWAPTRDQLRWSLADSESDGTGNSTSYHWFVMPCRTLTTCGADPRSRTAAQHTFTKKSPPVTGQSTTQTDGKEITFSWNDYWHDAASTNPADKWARTGENLPQSAMQYRIEVSKDATFGDNMLVERIDVDQTTYTSFTKTYEPGTYHWRVQAIDDFGNPLTWSDFNPATPERENATFTIAPPPVVLSAPVADARVPGTVAFTWQAQAYAKGYDIEVYKNNDTDFSRSNRIAFQEWMLGQSGGVLTTTWTSKDVLPPSDLAYLWRVRRIDSSGHAGPWSDTGRFFVDGASLSITSPAQGGTQPPDGPLLRWTQVPGASSYSVDFRPESGGTGTTDSGTAFGTAFASKKAFVTGTYVGSVTARDASGNAIGTAQVAFSVESRILPTSLPQISAPGGTAVGATLVSTAPTWNQPNVTMSYQWWRNTFMISGATGPTYTLTTADAGQSITLRVKAKKPNYADGEATSNAITTAAAPPPGTGTGGTLAATSAPVINGTPKVGSFLSATNGTWNSPPSSYQYQWLRSGVPIAGATTNMYRAVDLDALKTLTVRVTAMRSGWTQGQASSAPVTVAKIASATSAFAAPTLVKPSQRAKLSITVTASGVAGPTGTLVIKDGTKTLKKIALKASQTGRLTFKLPLLKVGTHKLKVIYKGSASVSGSRSKVTKLVVRR